MSVELPAYLIGGGGQAVSLMATGNVRIDGYVDCAPMANLELPYAGTDAEFMASHPEGTAKIHIAIVAPQGCDMRLRTKLIDTYSGYEAFSIIASTAIVVASSKIGAGCAIMHGAIVNGAEIGEHCVVNTGAIVEHGCRIGRNVFIGPGAVICGGVEIGDNVFIGAGATVRNGVKICDSAAVAMGAVVTADVTDSGLYCGVPAKRKEGVL